MLDPTRTTPANDDPRDREPPPPGFTLPFEAPASEAAPAPDPELVRLASEVSRGVSWLYWAVGLSVVNAITAAAGADWSFALALGASLVPAVIVHVLAAEAGMPWLNVIGVALALVPAGALFGLAWLGKRGKPWALVVAMMVYAGDTALFVFFEDGLGVILHLVCLWFVFRAWQATSALVARTAG
ncbi:hypothetical protein [Sandaracinus amylolyticus]|uniref:hypothetical protein n=1 Tax=Sandaracinus amylolyticus TaxID=927083 RepID=UPI001F277432|nr:hypothetical protein [Sandaracinus amylolyticus]UJR85248.1 Hypothetical protein I5071_73280 [Sandaracinus amylolyticus]